MNHSSHIVPDLDTSGQHFTSSSVEIDTPDYSKDAGCIFLVPWVGGPSTSYKNAQAYTKAVNSDNYEEMKNIESDEAIQRKMRQQTQQELYVSLGALLGGKDWYLDA